MKKIIFSSVCAVALLSVNANANVWSDKSTALDTEISSALSALVAKTGTAGSNYDTYLKAYEGKVGLTQTANDNLRDGQDKISARNSAGLALVGEGDSTIPGAAADAKNLTQLLNYYQSQTGKDTEIADVKKAISEVSSGAAITASLTGATGLEKTAYDSAQSAAASVNIEDLQQAITKAKESEATAKRDLDIAQAELNKEVAKTEGAAKLQSEYESLKANKASYDKAGAIFTDYEAAKLVVSTTKSEIKSIKDTIGLASDDKLKSSLYGKLAAANDSFKTAQKAVTEATIVRDTAKKALLGSAPGAFASDATATKQTSLKALEEFYKQDKTDTDGKKLAAVQAVIKAVEKGEKVPVDSSGKIIISEGVVSDDTWATIKGGVDNTAFDGAVADLDGKKNTLGVAKDDSGKPSGEYAKVAQAQAELAEAKKTLAEANADLAQEEAELAKIQSKLNLAKANTKEGKVVVAKVEKNIGADLASVAGGSVKQLAGLLLDDTTASEIAVSTLKAKGATAEQKEQLKQIQAAANAVAGAALEGKKEAVMGSSLGAMNVQINNMNKRLGEIRGLNGEVGTWFRAYGGRYSTDNDHFNYYSTQIGADKITNMGNGDLIVGALFGFDKVNADTSSKTYSLGGYLSYIDNDGFFADTVLKFGKTKHSKDGYSIKSQNIFLASVEGGYRFNIDDSLYVEPSLELITGRIGKYEAKTNNVTIGVDSFTPFVIKPQAFVGYSVNDFILRVGGGYVYNTKRQDATLRINEIVKDLSADAKVKLDKNNYGFASIGGSYKFNDNLRLNLGVERSFGGKLTQDYELNATIRYTF